MQEDRQETGLLTGRKASFLTLDFLGLKFEALVVAGAAEVGPTGSTYCPVGVGAGRSTEP